MIPHPELIHRVEGRLDSDPSTAGKIYEVLDYNWRRLDTIHLFSSWFSGGKFLIIIRKLAVDNFENKIKMSFSKIFSWSQ